MTLSGISADEVNKALDASLNTLEPANQRFIKDLLRFINHYPLMYTVIKSDGHFLYDMLTKANCSKKKLHDYYIDVKKKLQDLLTKCNPLPKKSKSYHIYELMSTESGYRINYKRKAGKFYMPKM